MSHPEMDTIGEPLESAGRATVRRLDRRAEGSACDEPESVTANGRPYHEKWRVRGWVGQRFISG